MKITRNQYYQLVGLKTLADANLKTVQDILSAALQITKEVDADGQPETIGHTCDAIYDTRTTVDQLLRNLNIGVSDRP